MDPLNERLDEVGWSEKIEWRGHLNLVFKWMQQATVEIARLQAEVEGLKRALDARTEHLA